MINLVLILGLFLLAIAVTMVLRALTTPAGPSTETIEQIGAYGFAGRCSRRTTEAGPGLRARVGDFAGSTGRWLGQRFTRLKGRTTARGWSRPACTRRRRSACSERSSSSAVGLAFLWFVLTAAAGAEAWLVLLANRRSGRPRLGAPDVHRRPAREEAPRAGRARLSRI